MEQIQDDVYLRPVLGDDALIISLDDLPQENQQIVDGGRSEDSITGSSREDGNLRKANADLQAQLDSLSQQFANYRLAVQQTLDKRWGVDGDDDSGESLVTTQASTSKPRQDDSEYYWESYAYHGNGAPSHQPWGLVTDGGARHSRDYAQGCSTNRCVPRLHLQQQASYCGQGSTRHWLRHR